jgi:hypothetical protein
VVKGVKIEEMVMVGLAECDGEPPVDTTVIVKQEDGVCPVEALQKTA